MQIKLITFALFGAVAAIPQVTTTRCNADNCARALTGTPATRSASRVAQCSTFQTTTVIVTTISGTPMRLTSSTNTVPPYLSSSCVNSAAYASACSCAGVTKGMTVVYPTAPASTPSTFRIFDQDNSVTPSVISPLYLGGDQQDYGNVGAYVLTRQMPFGASQPVFALVDDQLQTQETTPKYSLAYPGSASKIYFGQQYGDLSYNGMQYIKYSCFIGAFDPTVPGYKLSCASTMTGPDAFYQAGVNPNNGLTGNVGFGDPSQAQNEAQEPSGGAPDIFNQQLYAVGV